MAALLLALSSLPQPDPLPQPSPTWLLWALLLLTFFLHLVPMNLALGGSLLAVVARWRGRRDPHALALATGAAKALPSVFAATVTLGVAPLLFLQVLHGRVFFGSTVLMAWPWLSVVGLLLVAYYGTYRLAHLARTLPARGLGLAAIVSALLMAIAFLYSSNMSLMLRANAFGEMTADGTSGWQWNLADPTLVPRYLHMLLGAIAVGAIGLAGLGWLRRRTDPEFATWAMQFGCGWAAGATFVNTVVGSWWLFVLPRDVLLRFMGRDPAAAVALMTGIGFGLVVLALCALGWRAKDPAPAVRWAAVAMLGTLVAMAITRDQLRESALAQMGLAPATWVEPQWGPTLIFVTLLLMAIATIAWMVTALAQGRAEDRNR